MKEQTHDRLFPLARRIMECMRALDGIRHETGDDVERVVFVAAIDSLRSVAKVIESMAAIGLIQAREGRD